MYGQRHCKNVMDHARSPMPKYKAWKKIERAAKKRTKKSESIYGCCDALIPAIELANQTQCLSVCLSVCLSACLYRFRIHKPHAASLAR